jgi:hypothetical protein
MIQTILSWKNKVVQAAQNKYITTKEKITKAYKPGWFPIVLICVLVIIFSLLCMASRKDYYWVLIQRDTTKSITGVVMEVSGSFIGFLVIYLSISFDNLQSNFGKYALNLFRKDSLLTSVSSLFAVIIIVALSYYLLADNNPVFADIIFNLTCVAFISAVCLLIPLGNAVLNKSSSSRPIQTLIKKLSTEDFADIPPKRWMLGLDIQLAAKENGNRLNTICDVLYHNINAGNSKNTTSLLISLSLRFYELLKSPELTEDTRLKIHLVYPIILKSSFDLAILKNDTLTVNVIFASLNSWTESIPVDNADNAVEKIEELLEHMGSTLIRIEHEPLIDEWLWTYYHVSTNLLDNLLPDEKDIWTVAANGDIDTINTRSAEKKENLFDAIESLINFRFANTIERVFLSKNYYIIENGIRKIGSLIAMIIFNSEMGPIQKRRIGSMLAYYFEEFIKRYIDLNFSHQKNYLHLYIGSSTIIRALEQNNQFSKDVFNTAVNILDYSIEQHCVTTFDVEKLSGLCRLTIAHADNIADVLGYVESVLKVQSKLKSKCFAKVLAQRNGTDNEKELAALIKRDIDSYQAMMVRKAIINPALSLLISKYQ